MIGRRIAHYEIGERIGKGGMGEVYRARDTRLGRDVALKILPADKATDPDRLQRFTREAKVVAALNHPNIVTIHSVEEADGVHFLTMELVEGKTLHQLIPEKGLPLDQLFEIAIPMADALSAAHAKGVTHRDLKPSNIMIDRSGRLKVLDFGLAKLFAIADEAGDETLAIEDGEGDGPLTAEGKIMGTMAYMSPEQAESKELDQRSDIFSLGVVLYEMTTGERPFQGDTPLSTISSILKDTPKPVTERNAMLPRHLGRVIGRCLEKNPDRRYQTARDVCNELEGLQREVESGELELRSSTEYSREQLASAGARRIPWPWIAGLAAVVAAVATFALLRRAPAPSAAHFESTRLTSLAGLEMTGSWSPDGNFFAYCHSAQGPMDIFVASTSGGDPIALVASPYDDVQPRWSPDNRWIAFASGRGNTGVYLVPPLGGEPRLLLELNVQRLSNALWASLGQQPWSSDGSELAVAHRDESGAVAIWIVDVATGAERKLSEPQLGYSDGAPSFSPDGRELLYMRWSESGSELLTQSVEGGEPRALVRSDAEYLMPSWARDGRRILYSSPKEGGLWEVSRGGGDPRPLYGGGEYALPVMSKSGRILYGDYSHQTDLYIHDLADGATHRLTFHTQDNFGARFSPDGTRIAYESNRTGTSQIWLLDVDDGDERQLTDAPDGCFGADWAPDGRSVIYFAGAPSGTILSSVSVDGGAPRRLAEIALARGIPRVSPDGARIGFIALDGASRKLYSVAMDGGDRREELADVGAFAWYVDSSRVIYSPHGEREREVLAVDLSSGNERLLLETDHDELEVARDGSALSYCSSLSHFNMNLFVLDLAEGEGGLPTARGEPRQLTHGDGEWHVHNGGWAPDARAVVYTRDTDSGDLFVLDAAE